MSRPEELLREEGGGSAARAERSSATGDGGQAVNSLRPDAGGKGSGSLQDSNLSTFLKK